MGPSAPYTKIEKSKKKALPKKKRKTERVSGREKSLVR